MFANGFGHYHNVCCGLVRVTNHAVEEEQEDDDYNYGYVEPTQTPIPLMSVDVKAAVVQAVAHVEVTQVYENKEEQPIEAIYYFPMNPDGAVTSFLAEVDGRVIKGVVKRNEEAKEEYEEAIAKNMTAFLGEETKADIFKIRVGFLKPGCQAKVTIGYETEVKNEPGSNTIRFYLPTTIAPRYVSAEDTDDKAEDIKNMKFSHFSPAPLTLKVAVSVLRGIKSIESPTHKDKITVETAGRNEVWHKAIVQLNGDATDMDRDFVLNIVPEAEHKPALYSEKTEDGSTAMMIHLVPPEFKLDEQKTELIFVLDRSGSMAGKSITLAKKALSMFLRSMPADCYFNVVGFGSSFQFLFPTSSVKNGATNLQKAIKHAGSLKANLGGTEILKPLKEIYEKPEIKGYLRQLFVLTDGGVCDTDGVLGIAQTNAKKARVFSLGIGDSASHHLVEGLAKAGGGTSAFVTYNEPIDTKVLTQLKNGLRPSLTDIELEWEGVSAAADSGEAEASLIRQSPRMIPPVYAGSQLMVFGLFKDECPKSVKIKVKSPDGPMEIKLLHSPANDIDQGAGMLHRLAAIKLVHELQLEESALEYLDMKQKEMKQAAERLKNEIVAIACQNGISSKYTSFVAVDANDDKPSAENWAMDTRHVPSQMPNGYGHGVTMLRGGAVPRRTRRCMVARRRRSAPVSCKRPAIRRKASCASSATSCKKRRTSSAAASKRKTARKPKATAQVSSDSEDSDEEIMRTDSDDDDAKSPLMQLINLQAFDGSFTLSVKFAALVAGKSLKAVKDGAAANNLQQKVFATALAISYFETKQSHKKAKWELIVTKARKWLGNSIQQKGQVNAAVQAATTFIGA